MTREGGRAQNFRLFPKGIGEKFWTFPEGRGAKILLKTFLMLIFFHLFFFFSVFWSLFIFWLGGNWMTREGGGHKILLFPRAKF